MENIVSARRLRKSLINDKYTFNLYDKNNYKHKEKKEEGIKLSNKFLYKCLISSILLFTVVLISKNYSEIVLKNKIILRMYEHYKYDFSRCDILENFEEGIKKIDNIMGDIVPIKIKEKTMNIYLNKVKPYIINFDLYNILFKENKSKDKVYEYNDNRSIESNNKLSTISLKMDEIMKELSIIKPTVGIVTSEFGERDVIFEGVNPYHTGIDIANKIGTEVFSCSSGIITKVVYDDLYYGNYVEIESFDITFKYAHLSEILVENGEIVNQGELIGKMGSTGMSTGPHLHFEIKKDNVAIDPREFLEL